MVSLETQGGAIPYARGLGKPRLGEEGLESGSGDGFCPFVREGRRTERVDPTSAVHQLTPPAIESIKAWDNCDYLLTYELHVPRVGGPLQSALDLILSTRKGVGSWYIGGDFPRRYYEEADGQMRRVE